MRSGELRNSYITDRQKKILTAVKIRSDISRHRFSPIELYIVVHRKWSPMMVELWKWSARFRILTAVKTGFWQLTKPIRTLRTSNESTFPPDCDLKILSKNLHRYQRYLLSNRKFDICQNKKYTFRNSGVRNNVYIIQCRPWWRHWVSAVGRHVHAGLWGCRP